MRRSDSGLLAGLAWCLAASACLGQSIDPKGVSILQRVIDARAAEPAVSVELKHEIVGQGTRNFRIHAVGDQLLRLDEFAGETRVSTVLIDGEDAWGYQFAEHSDLHKTSREKIRVLGYPAFWPHVLGVTTLLTLDGNLEELLYSDADAIRVLPRQPVMGVNNEALQAAGVELDVVEVDRGTVTLSNAIDSRTGRIYRRLNFVNRREDSRAVSLYESKENPEWLPSKVTIVLGGRQEVISEIKCVSTKPDPSLFDLRSLGVRPGTSVVDVAMQRQMGTWNGVAVVGLDDARTPAP
jgi:hypothetical protein